jgi:hypothetical protein
MGETPNLQDANLQAMMRVEEAVSKLREDMRTERVKFIAGLPGLVRQEEVATQNQLEAERQNTYQGVPRQWSRYLSASPLELIPARTGHRIMLHRLHCRVHRRILITAVANQCYFELLFHAAAAPAAVFGVGERPHEFRVLYYAPGNAAQPNYADTDIDEELVSPERKVLLPQDLPFTYTQYIGNMGFVTPIVTCWYSYEPA